MTAPGLFFKDNDSEFRAILTDCKWQVEVPPISKLNFGEYFAV